MECCGRRRNTRYCGECGKDLRLSDPLEELLAHCRTQVEERARRVTSDDRATQRIFDGAPAGGAAVENAAIRRMNNRRKKLVDTLDKWTRWVEALEAKMGELLAWTQGET